MQEQANVNKRGQKIGLKGERARQSLLDGLRTLLDLRHPWEISVSDICGQSGVAQYNFYTYFSDVEEAILQIAWVAAREQPALVTLVPDDWKGTSGFDDAARLVDETCRFWSRRASVLLIADMLADRSVATFLDVRRARRRPLIDAFAGHIGKGQAAGRIAPALDPFLTAVETVTMLDAVGSHFASLSALGFRRDEIIGNAARLLQHRMGETMETRFSDQG